MRTLILVFAFIICFPCLVQANTCSISSSGMAFIYLTDNPSPTDSTGTITTVCDNGTSHTVSLSTGNSGSYTSRTMTAPGGGTLSYQIYQNAGRTAKAGDGTGGSVTRSIVGSATATIYGRIPALQNAIPGSYSDTLVVTISF